MKTLYLSDLDGTLLRGDQRLSDYTRSVVNRLVDRGVIFSYATARSFETASKVAAGLRTGAPVIVHNGALTVGAEDGHVLSKTQFSARESAEIFSAFRKEGLFPVVYSVHSGREIFSYLREACGRAQWEFILSRRGDEREREVFSEADALSGEVFYFTCIDREEKLSRIDKELRTRFRCLLSRDIYTGECWLEIMPEKASKAHAALALKEALGCTRIVCFGDQVNDVPLFEISDECYAVENAAEELKRLATGVIGSNERDGVARFLESRFHAEK